MKTFKELFEKKLTPAELKKREEIAKAMERENPGMEMGKKMAIATAAAKRVAEDVELDEAKTPEQKLQDIRDAIGLAREKRKMKGQRVQSQREIDLQKKHDDLSQQLRSKSVVEETEDLEEAGAFSYGAKPPRKGSVAYNAMMKRKEQEKNQKTIEPKDQMVGTAKVVKEENQYMSKIEGGKGKGKGFGDKSTTVDDHLSAMNYHSGEYQKAMKEKRDSDARHHGMKYHKHKDQIERLGDVGNYRKEDVDEAYMSSDRSKQMFKRKELDHELRHEVEPKRAEPAEPHAVHINGKKWKTFPTKSHATNVAKKIAGATVVKESIDEGKIPEMKYSDVMKKIKSGTHEATHDVKPGKHVELRHIDSGKKTTVYVKESEELDEAVDHHAEAMEHKKMSDAAMDKNDMEAYHHHMSAHHESMGQWHESKGRSSSADKEYEKAEKHHELSLKKSNQKNEGTEMLSFKYFQQALVEAKKKCKESSGEMELAHGELLNKDDEEDDEDEEMYVKEGQAPVAPAPGMKDGKYAIMVHPESKQRVTIERKNKKNYPASEGWKEVGLGMKESVELDEATTVVGKATKTGADKKGQKLGAMSAAVDGVKTEHEHEGKKYTVHSVVDHDGDVHHSVIHNGKQVHNHLVSQEGTHGDKPSPLHKKLIADHVTAAKKHLDKMAGHIFSDEDDEDDMHESVKLDEAAITHVVAKDKLAAHKEFMGKEGFDVTTKPLPKSHPKHATHVGIVSKNSQESSYHEDGNAVSESVELDEISTATMSHQGKTTLKHVKNPGVQLRMAAHDIKPGIKGYRDRVALMHAADAEKKLKEEVELDEVSPFDWKAYAKEKGTASSNKTKTFHDVKKTSTGTVYTKQVNPDGTSKGSGDDAAKTAEKADAPKRGRGRPAGVGAKTGSYKPRDPAAKAASAAKAAASKAANRAMRKEEFDNEFMGSLIEGFEDEDFDEFLYCEEFDELDEATQEALINFINEKSCGSYKMKESLTGKQYKLDKNKNGKIDSHDFKLLRKEETEQVQESVNTYAAFLTKKQ